RGGRGGRRERQQKRQAAADEREDPPGGFVAGAARVAGPAWAPEGGGEPASAGGTLHARAEQALRDLHRLPALGAGDDFRHGPSPGRATTAGDSASYPAVGSVYTNPPGRSHNVSRS